MQVGGDQEHREPVCFEYVYSTRFKSNQDRRRTYKNHFEFTLNKLYVWNMLEYERVIYMDADNLFFHNIDELFKCGHFCAVYMNPCNFHTGLFVVTPNATTYNSLLKSLATLPSYDGADQGFLTAYFSGLQKAPLFDPQHPFAEKDMPAMQRLAVIYNNNHMYTYRSLSTVDSTTSKVTWTSSACSACATPASRSTHSPTPLHPS